MDPQNDDNANIEAAEAERNCDLGERPVVNNREPDEQCNEALMEADIDDPDQVDLLEIEGEPEILEPEMVVVPNDIEDHVTGVENFEDQVYEEDANEVVGVNEDTKNVRRSHRVRLRSPRYYNDGMMNATLSDEDLPKSQECTQQRMATDEDVVTSAFEYVLAQY